MNQHNPPLTPAEVEASRRDLLDELKTIERLPRNNQGLYEVNNRTLADLVVLLEALKPVVVDRAVTDEDVEDFCREAWAQFYDWDERAQAVHRRTARRALEMPLPQPAAVDREALAVELGSHRKVARYPSGGWKCACEGWGSETWSQHLADAVLAALYPKATEGKS